ncbi:MAG: external sensor signal transduction histidine kinase [Candidatus Peregrinibacteria bacterium Greene1014_49]|nr:MAG: external sensor signal transduction histidine kinase [Candidatus Peregrinibacteria bacterium Greene1014_49]
MPPNKITKNSLRGISPRKLGFFAVLIAILITIGTSWILYQHTVNILTDNLRERLLAIVRTAATEFNPTDLEILKEEKDYKKKEWNKVVNQLLKIRLNNKNVIFAYILRKSSDDPSQMVFVSDSHSLDPYAKIDLDQNGIIDDADALNWPGQIYEDVPQEAFDGYIEPTTNKDLYIDQWGTLLSGYAPIKDDKGETVGVMTVDVRANDFVTITRQTFFPFIIFIIFLVVILLVQAFCLISIWSKQVRLIAELDRQKDELLSIVSHQLNAPVTAIKWYLELLTDAGIEKFTKEQVDTVQSMQSITVNLADLVGMILDVSRIQLGKVKVDPQPLDLNELCKEILSVVEPKAKDKNIHFVKTMPASLPTVLLDKRLTRMTVENLLTNAVKYTPEKGNVDFVIEKRGDVLHCEVRDTGCGIPKEEQGKVFDKLYRASNVRNKVEGNGFGLFAAKGAIEAQGGKIWFESIEGKGTTFFIELPLKYPEKK